MNLIPTLRSHLRRCLGSRGQSVVEFALILPVLMLMLLITLDFGRLFMSYVTLNNVTRVAANLGALDPGSFTGGTPNTTTYDAVVARESVGLNCDINPEGGHNPPIPTYPDGSALGKTSVVTMTCDFALLTPFISSFFGATVPVSAEARFPVRTGAIAAIGGTTTVPPPGGASADFNFTGVSGGTVNGSGNVDGTDPVTVNVLDGSVNAQTWEWTWGDGSTQTNEDFGPTPLPHTYTSSGTYTVTLTVTNPQGSSSRSRTVTVTSASTPPPVAGFYGTPQGVAPQVGGGGSGGLAITGTRGTRVDFTNLSSGANAYSWDFGDGTSPSTQTSPQHPYSNLGIFDVVLSITDPAGASSFTRTGYVTIGCLGPLFTGTSTAATAATWSTAGFSGQVRYKAQGSGGNGNQNPPSLPKTILSQEGVQGGQLVAPTKNGNNPWRCNDGVTVVYQP
jgi:PKD repeat protein